MSTNPKSPSLTREVNPEVLCASESVGELNCPIVESSQAAGTISSTLPTDSHSFPESMAQNVDLPKKEQEKEKDTINLQKHRVPESVKVVKDHKIGSRPKAGAQRNRSGMMRKNLKSAGISSGSGMGRLAVFAS